MPEGEATYALKAGYVQLFGLGLLADATVVGKVSQLAGIGEEADL